MGDPTSLLNIGELSKPASILIEKISDAIGGIAKPFQIRRVAQAEIDAEIIKAKGQIKITELERRALQRFAAEEAIKQSNIEAITTRALVEVNPDANPENMENDWIVNFYDKCRLISNDEMQALWSKVLASEANKPGTFSKRTVNFLGTLDKTDALLFQTLCGYSWEIGGKTPLIFDSQSEIYIKNNITFGSLKHLDEIGLLSFESLSGYIKKVAVKTFGIEYFGKALIIDFEKDTDNQLPIGKVILSKVGEELASICGANPVGGFFEFVQNEYQKKGIKAITPEEKNKEDLLKKENP